MLISRRYFSNTYSIQLQMNFIPDLNFMLVIDFIYHIYGKEY